MPQNNVKPTVLMVDDDPDFQTIVRGWISPHYDHVGLMNGEALIEELAGLEPKLVILDVNMPGLDGFTLCSCIRADRRFTDLPILFITGRKEDEAFVQNLNAGGTAYLTKPIKREQLLSMLRELIGPVSALSLSSMSPMEMPHGTRSKRR